MLVTLDGIVICSKDQQLVNALPPMIVTLNGIVICRKELQPQKALSPILVTLDGIVKLFLSEINEIRVALPAS